MNYRNRERTIKMWTRIVHRSFSLIREGQQHQQPSNYRLDHAAKKFTSLIERSPITSNGTDYVRRWTVRWFTAVTSSPLVVSILGPPNAGKSTLFNRLLSKEKNKAYRLGIDQQRRRRQQRFRHRGKGRIGTIRPNSAGTAIVSAVANTTRDRRECWGRLGGTEFLLVDTAGINGERIGLLHSKTQKGTSKATATARTIANMEKQMIQQTMIAARQCDLILLMVDARVGMTQDLQAIAQFLRKLPNPQPLVVVLANKLEGDAWNYEGSPELDCLEEIVRLGFGEAIPISAEHGEGMADIALVMEQLYLEKKNRQKIQTQVNDGTEEKNVYGEDAMEFGGETTEQGEKPLQLAILGRQNVGKSTLVNSLLKQERVIAGETPGLTRDAIRIEWEWNGRPVQLVDTAGIRKLTKRMDDEIEDMAVADALRAMKTADVAVLVLDAQAQYLQRQELAIANAVIQEGRALVVAANKMDLLEIDDVEYTPEDFAAAVRKQLEIRFPMLRMTPVVPMSSLKGECVENLMPIVFTARDRWARTIPTGTLNRWLKEVLDGSPPTTVRGVTTKIKYIMQTKGRPPTFLLFCNVSEIPEPYLRYLTKHFQDTFEMYGMQVRMVVKKSATNPYERKDATRRTRNGAGLGGKEARRKRLYKQLKETGGPLKRQRKRRQKRNDR